MPTVWASRTIPWDGTRDVFCYWLRWGSRSVWKNKQVITVRTRKQKKDTSVTDTLVNADNPRSKTRTQMYLEMNKPLEETPFREVCFFKSHQWKPFWHKTVAITCKADTWVIQDIPAAVALLNYIYMWPE